jgi:hypothetical protein
LPPSIHEKRPGKPREDLPGQLQPLATQER